MCKSVIFAHYHKSGCAYSLKSKEFFSSSLGWDQQSWENKTGRDTVWGRIFKGWYGSDPKSHKELRYRSVVKVSNPADTFEIPNNTCLVHWYRDPRLLLVSSYRYHASEKYAEAWEFENRTCHRCDVRSLRHIFGKCHKVKGNCTYWNVLKAAKTEEEGLELDAIMEKKMLGTMMGNLRRWANDPRVLHLSMDHLRLDAEATTRCLMTFLGRRNDSKSMLYQGIKALPELHPTHASYNNTHLVDFLQNHKAWGNQLRASGRGSTKIFKRQLEMFGCPVPSL